MGYTAVVWIEHFSKKPIAVIAGGNKQTLVKTAMGGYPAAHKIEVKEDKRLIETHTKKVLEGMAPFWQVEAADD